MSLPYTTVASSTISNYRRKVRDDVFVSTPLIRFLSKNMNPVDGGLTISKPVMYNQATTADVFPGGIATLPLTFNQNTTLAVWSPAYYYGSVMIPKTFQILNKGQAANVNLVAAQFEQVKMTLVQKLNSDAFSAGASRNSSVILQGLQAVCTSGSDPAGGSYGGISRSGASGSFSAPVGNGFWNASNLVINSGSQTVWNGSVNPGAATTVSMQAMIASLMAAAVGDYHPTAIFCDFISYGGFANNLMANYIRQNSNDETFRQGANQFEFAGIPLFADPSAPSGYMFFVNDMLQLQPWEDGIFVVTDWLQPVNALVDVKFILFVAQMTHDRPNTMVALSGITG